MKITERKQSLKDVRSAENVPGVIYGKKVGSVPIQATYQDFMKAYKEYGKTMTFEVRVGGKKHQAYIKAVQFDPIKRQDALHFDLQQVSATDTITADIPVYVLNKDVVEAKGLVVQQVEESLETEYAVGKGITHFEYDVSELGEGDAVYVKDLEVAEGLKILGDPERMIINVTLPTFEEEPEEDVEEDEDVEVEAIKQKGDDDTEEETDE